MLALQRLRVCSRFVPLPTRFLQTNAQPSGSGELPVSLLKTSGKQQFDPTARSRFRYVPKKTQRGLDAAGKPAQPLILRGLPRRKKLLRRQRLRQGTPQKWNRPIAHGVLPAYDEALRIINADSRALKTELSELKKEVQALDLELQNTSDPEKLQALDTELEQMKDKLDIIEIQSEINLPNVRWAVRDGNVDMDKLVHRYLLEQSWREGGALDLLMERLYQMHVVPDLLPALHPSLDLRLTTGLRPKGLHPKAKNPRIVEPGSFLQSKQTIRPPSLYTTVYHTDTRLYTLVLLDPDVPDEASHTFTTFLHWLKPNIPLSSKSLTRLADLNDHTPYIPPHPQQGSPYHRYSLFLLPQPPLTSYSRNALAKVTPGVPTSKYLDIPVVPDEERLGFNLRALISKWNIDPVNGGGAHMWRQVWDEGVSRIYKHILKVPEPRYGLPPKVDPYEAIRHRKKY